MPGKDIMNPRTCIVSRTQKPPDEMVRFVATPQNRVVADLKRQLPGRGVWVTARREMVDEAVRRKLFLHGFGPAVIVDESLGDQIDTLLCKAALGALGMTKKAGLVLTGSAKLDKAIRKGEIAVLVHARDAAPDGVRKLDQAIIAAGSTDVEKILTSRFCSREELDKTLGGSNLAHVAVRPGGATGKLIEWLDKMESYRK